MVTAYIGLGSNLNNPTAQLQKAIVGIKAFPKTTFIACSRFYRTKPWGFLYQPDFLNAVVAIETDLTAEALMLALQQLENRLGRARSIKNGPRVIDCDLLLYGEAIIQTQDIIVPHPRLKERLFVLAPLQDVAPDLILPSGEDIPSLIRQCDMNEILEIITPSKEFMVI